MTFENQYLTYAEYLALGGDTIGETPFNLLEYEARKQVDLRTHKRLVDVETIPQEVKLCIFHLIDKIRYYASATQSGDGNISQESIDGYSITYLGASQINQVVASKNVELQDIIVSDLYGVIINNEHLIYAGV